MGKINIKALLNFAAYIAVALIGVALIVKAIVGADSQFGSTLSLIAQIIAYVLVAVYGFLYARSKRSLVLMIVWVVSIILIVVSYVI